jgi:hypothetical protein
MIRLASQQMITDVGWEWMTTRTEEWLWSNPQLQEEGEVIIVVVGSCNLKIFKSLIRPIILTT